MDQENLDAQCGKGAGVFAADDATADDRHAARHEPQVHHLVGVPDTGVVEREQRRPQRRGAGGDEDDIAAQRRGLLAVFCDDDRVRISEAAVAVIAVDAVAAQVLLDGFALGRLHPPLVSEEVLDGSAAPDRKVDTQQVPRAER